MTAPPPPLPVQPLHYDTAAAPQYSLRSLLRGVGILLLVFGALQALAHGVQLAAWLLHLADPYYWDMRRNQAFISGLPSSYLLTAIGVFECLSGLAGVVAGLACLGRRPWVRPAALTYAVAESASRLLMTGTWLSTMFTAPTFPGTENWIMSLTQVAWLFATLGLPALLLILFLPRRPWQTA